jgi:peptidoglycan/xylan/chitin deacetylase (PgdA/CDA1 family)
VRPNRLRPPYGAGWVGSKNEVLIKVAAELGLKLTGWDVDTNDWKAPRGLLDSKEGWEFRTYEDAPKPPSTAVA